MAVIESAAFIPMKLVAAAHRLKKNTTMTRATLTTCLLACSLALAATVPGVRYYQTADLKSHAQTLLPKAATSPIKAASEKLDDYNTHYTMQSYRAADGEGEIHETVADFFVVRDGEATLVTGGTLDKPRTDAPGELRGPTITGGEKRKLAAGDVVHIPAKVPHRLLVEKGKTFTYFVIKVRNQ